MNVVASKTITINPPVIPPLDIPNTLSVVGNYQNFSVDNYPLFGYFGATNRPTTGYRFLWEHSTTANFASFSTIEIPASDPSFWQLRNEDFVKYPVTTYVLPQTTYFRLKIMYGTQSSTSNVVSIVR